MLSRIRGLTFTSMAHFLNDGTFLIFPLLIVYYEEIHVSDVILGTVAVLYTLLSGILSPFIGDFADKSEKDSLLIMTGILLEGIAMVSFAVSFRTLTYPLMMLGAILLGIGQAFYHPIGGSILSNLFGKSSGRALGINGSAGSVGRSLMPSLVSFLILLFTAIYGLLIYGVIMIVGAVVIRLGLEGYSKATRLRKPKEKLERQFVRFIILLGVMVFLRSMFITGVTTFTGKYVFSIYHSAFLAGYSLQ
ncbi:MFS transporter [Sulfuracidifex tepidarius]|uniref:MFS transporter n=1 Tax=Sulfuracidifex tepidarius TaxID=1294262 RepID=UPI000AC97A5D|nr:MFS transporter [Sulfuracidifex tepidarius]